ncbi:MULTISPECIES: type VI secretion system lipoprotein TssJ [unclassified Caballeronia]|uniref:type VI secretion system lipoprotein TssJ n=1 Tax=unclassified Caballeronia TaxID=2646786 RepID=UPI00285436A8|nr:MULTISPECIES: type VI secretion system lipoprotein TssJ [unclassified Caballeronia]MDR5774824.1 type VI secretion system lipoprotein TssJ [Caballeronia sp. LZ002]MDR5850260.1 type VI secretion system lipoprotein TssJ [Caballeronia sp. LZ003]
MLKRFSAASVAATLLLSGCGAWQTVSDTSVDAYNAVFHKRVKVLDVDLTARAGLNQDAAGRSTSVAVRIYQLKDRKLFDSAAYGDLIRDDKTMLAQDLQASLGVVVNPAASASLSQPLEKETAYIAIAAFYRDPPANGSWKQVVEAKKLSADAPLKLELSDRQVTELTDTKASGKK